MEQLKEVVLLEALLLVIYYLLNTTRIIRFASPRSPMLVFGIVNMLLVPIFALKSIHFGWLTSNIGNIFYANTLLAAITYLHKWGYKEFTSFVTTVFSALMIFLLTTQAVLLIPSINPPIGGAYITILKTAPQIITASFFAFIATYLTVFFLAKMTRRFGDFWQKVIVTIVSQCVDSLIFFPVAFAGVLETKTMIQFMVSGYVIKVIIGFVDTFVYIKVIEKEEVKNT